MNAIDNIIGLINKEELQRNIDINTDSYGSACVNVAIAVMKYLDEFRGEFNIGYHPDMTTPHGIICHADDQGELTGFMAGAVRNMVARCYKDGWKFYLADMFNPYNLNNEQDKQKYIESVTKVNLTSVKEATEYVDKLIMRYGKRN